MRSNSTIDGEYNSQYAVDEAGVYVVLAFNTNAKNREQAPYDPYRKEKNEVEIVGALNLEIGVL